MGCQNRQLFIDSPQMLYLFYIFIRLRQQFCQMIKLTQFTFIQGLYAATSGGMPSPSLIQYSLHQQAIPGLNCYSITNLLRQPHCGGRR